jgi:hypothetical protein
MTPRLLLASGVTAVLLLGTAGCGDPEKKYCAALKADQETFSEMQDDTSGVALLGHLPLLHRLADKAPDDLSDEWQVLLGALDSFSHTLDEVGVSPDDFVAGKPPAGLSVADQARVAHAADVLSSPDVVDAANGIEQQAKDVCKLQLGL